MNVEQSPFSSSDSWHLGLYWPLPHSYSWPEIGSTILRFITFYHFETSNAKLLRRSSSIRKVSTNSNFGRDKRLEILCISTFALSLSKQSPLFKKKKVKGKIMQGINSQRSDRCDCLTKPKRESWVNWYGEPYYRWVIHRNLNVASRITHNRVGVVHLQ